MQFIYITYYNPPSVTTLSYSENSRYTTSNLIVQSITLNKKIYAYSTHICEESGQVYNNR